MKNNKSFLYYALIILLFNQIISQTSEEMQSDEMLCMASDEDSCTNVQLNSGVYQCCKITGGNSLATYTGCQVQMTSISAYKEQIENKATKALIKEMFGYTFYNGNSQSVELSQLKYEYNCKDGNATLLYGYDTYTDDEINVLKSENHCLKYMNNKNYSVSKEDCFKSVLTQNAKDAGHTCGFFELSVQYYDNTVDNIKTCHMFNKGFANYTIR